MDNYYPANSTLYKDIKRAVNEEDILSVRDQLKKIDKNYQKSSK